MMSSRNLNNRIIEKTNINTDIDQSANESEESMTEENGVSENLKQTYCLKVTDKIDIKLQNSNGSESNTQEDDADTYVKSIKQELSDDDDSIDNMILEPACNISIKEESEDDNTPSQINKTSDLNMDTGESSGSENKEVTTDMVGEMFEKRIFTLSNEKPLKGMWSLYFKDEEENEDFGEDSDTDNQDFTEVCEEGSDTSQDNIDFEDTDYVKGEYFYTGRDGTKWYKQPPYKKVKKHPPKFYAPKTIGEATRAQTILQCWNCLIDDNILELIMQYTNEYISSIKSKFERKRDVKTTDKIEIKAFIGLLYLAGILQSKRQNLEELWGTDGFGVELFRMVMNLRRFKFLMRCLHFDNIETREERKTNDVLAPIRDIFNIFVENCKKSYSPSEKLTIYEKLENFRGKCPFTQYVPKTTKRSKCGIKIYTLVDAQTLYTYNMEIYTGNLPEVKYVVGNKYTDVVKRLSEPLFNSGRTITANNWLSDLELVAYLKNKKLSYVGAVKKSNRVLPPEFVNVKKRQDLGSIYGFNETATIVSYVPRKHKTDILISSLHSDIPNTEKDDVMTFFNDTKSAGDLMDKLCGTYNVARNSQRWPMVLFFAMLNISGLNSQIIYVGNKNEVKNRRVFLKQLIRELVEEELVRRSSKVQGIPSQLRRKLDKYKSPEFIKVEEASSSMNTGIKRKRCNTCSTNKKSRLSKYKCQKCYEFVCLEHAIFMCNHCFNPVEDSDLDE